ncbi:G-type lectin S-receptor-like serine/threonine-protein kinase SD2-5 [Zingiber officinale]|uniref:G-type lectin S-receptor-like serine/threonine-protein kinase SD2-5 n=1 Tax=Zingiber officinale TaxID=94328 RepID=UPI001C4C6E9C|nr:G-type lectin S-receptor-like serine/threonine-protein kinase SD2-5 [Zingiber officinale]
MSDSSGDGSAATAVVLSSVISIVFFVVIVVLICKCINKLGSPVINVNAAIPVASSTTPSYPAITNEKIWNKTVEDFLNEIAGEKPIRFTSQQLDLFTGNYATQLGAGGFGSVYKGKLPNGVPVAVKVFRCHLDNSVKEQFMAEVGTMGRTYHINLVRLYGFCFDAAVRALVYEYMEKGSLDKYLYDKDQKLNWETMHEVAIGTAKGIRYLHEECQQKIIHYDIKPGNILLDSNFNPKVADFGLAKLMNRVASHVTLTGNRGTPGYMAPEIWMNLPVTHKCDVYSFGMLLFDVVGRKWNRGAATGSGTESLRWFPKFVYQKFEGGALGEIISNCEIEEDNREEAERMCKVALWCVQMNADARPPMSKVVKMLEGEMEIVPVPMNDPFPYLNGAGPEFDVWNEGGNTTTGSSLSNYSATTPIMRKYEIGIETHE